MAGARNPDNLTTKVHRLKLDIYRLQQAVAAADYGSFRQAADTLSIKQSTLSRSIQLLEHSFGIIIFERSRAGVRATPAGHDFLRMARSILEQMDTLLGTTRAIGRGENGRFVIGFSTSLTAGNLRATLLDFKARYPRVELGAVERSRTRMISALRNGAVDLYITTGDPTTLDSKATPLWSERILVVLPDNHSLASQEIIYWTDLRCQTVLLSQYDLDGEVEGLLNAKLISSTERPRIQRYDVSRGVLKSLISMGLGIGLVLESDTDASFSGLVYRELRDGMGSSRIGFSAVWRDDNENPALANFLELLAERYPLLSVA